MLFLQIIDRAYLMYQGDLWHACFSTGYPTILHTFRHMNVEKHLKVEESVIYIN